VKDVGAAIRPTDWLGELWADGVLEVPEGVVTMVRLRPAAKARRRVVGPPPGFLKECAGRSPIVLRPAARPDEEDLGPDAIQAIILPGASHRSATRGDPA
jgi:hypothetical protein